MEQNWSKKSIGNKKAPTNYRKGLILLARPAGIEPTTKNLEGSCSIQLSYGRTGTGAEPCRVAHNIEIAPHAVKLCGAWARRRMMPPQKTSIKLPSQGSSWANFTALDSPAPTISVHYGPFTEPWHSTAPKRAANRHASHLQCRGAARPAAVLPLTCGPLCAKLFA